MDPEMQLVKSDVTVEDAPADECDECTGSPANFLVMVDFRSAGMMHTIGRYCRACAENEAERIRDGLPA